MLKNLLKINKIHIGSRVLERGTEKNIFSLLKNNWNFVT